MTDFDSDFDGDLDTELDTELDTDLASDDPGTDLTDFDGENSLPGLDEPDEPHLGYAYTVDGTTESGNAVAWSTSNNEYYDQKTWETVEPT